VLVGCEGDVGAFVEDESAFGMKRRGVASRVGARFINGAVEAAEGF